MGDCSLPELKRLYGDTLCLKGNVGVIYPLLEGTPAEVEKHVVRCMDAAKENWVQFPAGCKINIDGLTLPRQSKPWTFSIYGGYMETDPSDVAVTPVQVEQWSRFDYPWDLDDW